MPDLYTSDQKDERKASGARESHHDLPGHTHNPLAAYSYQPDGVHFETQEDDERIVLFLRQHPIVNIPWIALSIILILAPRVLTYFPLLSFLPPAFQFVALLLWYLVVSAFIIESALSWFFNVYLVTTERVIDIDFVNLIYKEVSEADLSKIQDTSNIVKGVVGTLFNFGDVEIETAGAVEKIQFENVPRPGEVARIINQLREGAEGER